MVTGLVSDHAQVNYYLLIPNEIDVQNKMKGFNILISLICNIRILLYNKIFLYTELF